jgi:NAD(P)-dependent dehydrogenase (short-subunit alcohol dehydrogenase family)
MLQQIVSDMGSGTPIEGDAIIPEDVQRIVSQAAATMGGLDLVIYAAGYGVLQPLVNCNPEDWSSVHSVNVIGANLVAGASLEHLSQDGVIAFLSSRTAEDNSAFFSPYSSSKAALDHCIRTWRIEHPDRRFIRVTIGNCAPTEFGNHMGDAMIGKALKAWEKQGIYGGLMMVDDVAEAILESLAVSLAHPEINLPELRLDARPTRE